MMRIATRGSRLARWQAEHVGARLGGDVEYVLVETHGDADQTSDIHRMGGQGVFVKEVQQAVLDGGADVAVHSAKDLPAMTAPGLVLASIPERADPRDALVGIALAAIPDGGRIGTGSVRRRAQLAHLRPDLAFGPLRGNIETRLRKRVDEGYDAIVVAFAALERLGLAGEVAEVLEPAMMLPQVAQGALGVECRAGDEETRARLEAIDDLDAHTAVTAERRVPRRARRRMQPSVRCARNHDRRNGRARSAPRVARRSRRAARPGPRTRCRGSRTGRRERPARRIEAVGPCSMRRASRRDRVPRRCRAR